MNLKLGYLLKWRGLLSKGCSCGKKIARSSWLWLQRQWKTFKNVRVWFFMMLKSHWSQVIRRKQSAKDFGLAALFHSEAFPIRFRHSGTFLPDALIPQNKQEKSMVHNTSYTWIWNQALQSKRYMKLLNLSECQYPQQYNGNYGGVSFTRVSWRTINIIYVNVWL